MNTFNVDASSQSQSSSTPAPTTALRTRNRRLVNILDEDSADETPLRRTNSQNGSHFLSPYSSRAPSPIPDKHPSRSSSLRPNQQRSNASDWNWSDGHSRAGLPGELTTQFNGLWGNSWSTLQGLASTVLGSDASSATGKDNASQRTRRPREATHSPIRAGTLLSKWGPSAPGSPRLGAGTQEERQSMVRAKKREELLMANGSTYLDNAANFKRRNSDDSESMSAPPPEGDDRDALVYIHHVKPEDTLAGISIKFGCTLAVLKSSNRMWSNDTVQSRKTVVIPVDGCSVKGRRVQPPDEDLLVEDTSIVKTPTPAQPKEWLHHRRGSSSTIKAPAKADDLGSPSAISISSSQRDPDAPWTHDSWVQLDNHPDAIEIARLARRDLGFFPRARRKSACAPEMPTRHDYPSISLGPTRSPTKPTAASSHATMPPLTRARAGSNTSSQFAALMHGPGGVGRLVGRSPVRGPGPSEDKLNKLFAPHLPSVAPPATPTPYIQASPLASQLGSRAPRASFDSETSTTSNNAISGLENMGGAIEGWMRKVATRAARMVEPGSPLLSPRSNSNNNNGGTNSNNIIAGAAGATSGVVAGDLIELSDASELGDEDAGVLEREHGATWDAWERGRRRLSAVEEREVAAGLRARAGWGGGGGGSDGWGKKKKKGD